MSIAENAKKLHKKSKVEVHQFCSYIAKPVNKRHWREPGNVPYMSSCPSFTGSNKKVKLQFMEGMTIYACSSGFHNDWVASWKSLKYV